MQQIAMIEMVHCIVSALCCIMGVVHKFDRKRRDGTTEKLVDIVIEISVLHDCINKRKCRSIIAFREPETTLFGI